MRSAIGDERISLGNDRDLHHDLNLSLNVYLTKEAAAELMASTDPIIRSLALLDRRFDRALLEQLPPEPTCCDECAALWRACLAARRLSMERG